VNLPPPKNSDLVKTIIFDMDETLIHCVEDADNDNPDVVLTIEFPTGEVVDAGINIRPFAIDCLRRASKNFQVVVFTASHQSYADAVLDYLDPDKSLIDFRMYRDHCIQTEEGIYIKDLRVIRNRELKNMAIVDNAAYSFGY
jgi:CTD small phosphatase-like protein 2